MSERAIGPSEIARVFLKIGAMSYGGPAIVGIMQAEIQEKRQWIGKEQFVEGLSLVNMLPGPVATQHAAPDAFTAFLLIASLAITLLRNVGPLPLITSGALAGVVGRHLPLERIKELVE